MSKQVMISMLNQANNGQELLTILDSLTAEDNSSEYKEPTSEFIDF